MEANLAAVGFDVEEAKDVALVETALRGRPPERVLVQNAWNFIDRPAFRRLSKPYQPADKARMIARRALATRNVHRASRAVTMTDYMASIVGPCANEVKVAPVTLPLDIRANATLRDDPLPSGTALVPGTVTWYKAPAEALSVVELLKARGVQVSRVLFAGADDASGSWSMTCRTAANLSIPVQRAVLSRSEMITALASASVTILPSRLESLGFSLAEALAISPVVVASSIAPHIEVSERVGRAPMWWDGSAVIGNETDLSVSLLDDRWFEEWRRLAAELRGEGV